MTTARLPVSPSSKVFLSSGSENRSTGQLQNSTTHFLFTTHELRTSSKFAPRNPLQCHSLILRVFRYRNSRQRTSLCGYELEAGSGSQFGSSSILRLPAFQTLD